MPLQSDRRPRRRSRGGRSAGRSRAGLLSRRGSAADGSSPSPRNRGPPSRPRSRRGRSSAPPTNTSPPVGGTSLRIPLPVVVLPQPLSPPRQKISPLPTSRSTPSTARTYSGVALRNAARNPRRFSNQTRKSRRTRYGSPATSRRLLRRRCRGVQVARREVALADRVEARFLVDAQRPRILASRMEATADRRVDQGRQEARDVRRPG